MNIIFFWIILIAFLFTGYQQLTWIPETVDTVAPMQVLTNAVTGSSKASVTLAVSLIGVMEFFLGLMKVAEDGGLLRVIAKLLPVSELCKN